MGAQVYAPLWPGARVDGAERLAPLKVWGRILHTGLSRIGSPVQRDRGTNSSSNKKVMGEDPFSTSRLALPVRALEPSHSAGDCVRLSIHCFF
jgi:hypothetical protein